MLITEHNNPRGLNTKIWMGWYYQHEAYIQHKLEVCMKPVKVLIKKYKKIKLGTPFLKIKVKFLFTMTLSDTLFERS